MKTSDLVETLSKKLKIEKEETKKFFIYLNEIINDCLRKKEKISLLGLGTFQLKQRQERTCKVPKSEQIVTIPAHLAPVFKISKKLKNSFKEK